MYGGKAKVAYMVRSALFVQQYIPICPGSGSVVKIVNHGEAVFFAPFPFVYHGKIKTFGTAFGKNKVFVGISFGNAFHVFVNISATGPTFVPMIPNNKQTALKLMQQDLQAMLNTPAASDPVFAQYKKAIEDLTIKTPDRHRSIPGQVAQDNEQ